MEACEAPEEWEGLLGTIGGLCSHVGTKVT